MKSDIWMPMYWAEFLADTLHLSREDLGSYCLLIAAYWRNHGPLPDDDQFLRQICRCPDHQWARTKGVVGAFFQIERGSWRHGRIDAELARAMKIADERSKAGKAGADARWGEEKQEDDNGMANAIPEPLANASQNDAHVQSQLQSPLQLQAQEQSQKNTLGDLAIADRAESVYSAYPRKVGKPAAVRAITKALKTHAFEKILEATTEFAAKWRGQTNLEFCPHPATWFNQERFNDDPSTWGPKNGAATVQKASKPW